MAKADNQKRLLLFVGIGVILVLFFPLISSLISIPVSIFGPTPVPVPSENPFSISDQSMWLNFKDDQAKFSVSYPPELYVADTPFGVFHTTFLLNDLKDLNLAEDIAPRVQIFVADEPLEEFLKGLNEQRDKEHFPEFTQIEIKDYTAYQTKPYDQEVVYYHTVISDGEKTYLIELFTREAKDSAGVLIDAYEKMLNSFEIITNE